MLLQMAKFHFLWLSNILYISHIFFIHSSVDVHLGCSHILAIIDNVAMKMWVHVCFELVFLLSLGIYPGVELLDHMVTLFLVFWGTSILFSIINTPIYNPTNSVPGFPFLHILAAICFCRHFDDSHFDRCEAVSHYCFDLHFSDDWQCWAIFHIPVGDLYIFFGKMSIQIFCPCNWVLFFFDIELYELFIYFVY